MTPPASTEPHPLRCETCEKYGEGKYADTCENIPFPDHMDSADRQYIKDWIREHGCASHSARGPVVQQTALQMCDSFLDEIHDILKLDNDKVTDALVELYNLGLLWKERPDVKVSSGVAQPAPAAHYCTHLKWLTQIEGDGDYRCELGNKTSCEWCEGKSRCGDYQSVHDAALIAQEREKWERERAEEHRTYESCHKHFACPDGEECWYSSADYYWDCGNGAARVFEAVQKAKAQAREDVLKEMCGQCPIGEEIPNDFSDGSAESCDECLVRKVVRSKPLRPGQKQESEE